MSYYQEKRRAIEWLETRVAQAKKNDIEISSRMLLYEASKRFAVGHKPLVKHMHDMVELDGAPIDIDHEER